MTLGIFSYSLICILRDPRVFFKKLSTFNVVKAPTCHYILQEKKKIGSTGNLRNTS